MTNRSPYLTVTTAPRAPWNYRHRGLFALTLVGVLAAIALLAALDLKIWMRMPLLVPGAGWALAGWLGLCLAQRRRDERQDADTPQPAPPPLTLADVLAADPDVMVGHLDRDLAIEFLNAQYTSGDLDDFDHGWRHTRVLQARTVAQLRDAVQGQP